MFKRLANPLQVLLMSVCVLFSFAALSRAATLDGNGIVKVESAYPMAETIARIKAGVAKKGDYALFDKFPKVAYILTIDRGNHDGTGETRQTA